MQLILFTTPNFLPHETETVNRMFNAGLQTLHLRKPDTDAAALRQYLQQIQPQHLPRVMLHQHHELAAEYPLKVSRALANTCMCEHASECCD
jgi:thiamine-phosphate pyrophosphorylase